MYQYLEFIRVSSENNLNQQKQQMILHKVSLDFDMFLQSQDLLVTLQSLLTIILATKNRNETFVKTSFVETYYKN